MIRLVVLAALLGILVLAGCGGGGGGGTSSFPTVESSSDDAPSDGPTASGASLVHQPAAPQSAQNPAFAPDGATLLFTLFHQGYNAGPAGLFTVPVAGGAASPLLDEPDHDAVNLPGTCIDRITDRVAFSSDRIDRHEIWTMGLDGSGLFRVTVHAPDETYLEPSFSPDGGRIVFEARDVLDRGAIWRVDADGSGLTRLTSGLDDRQPNWSPVDQRIVFQRRSVGAEAFDLYTMAADGTDLRQVTTSPADDTDASWSPDGLFLVYSTTGDAPDVPGIFVIPADGGVPVPVALDEVLESAAPSWSPDGRSIVFERRVQGTADSRAAIWRVDAPRP